MALKLFRRKSKAAKEPKAETKVEKKVKVDKKVVEDVMPDDAVKVERVAAALADKPEPIDEEGDVSTVESGADEPANEAENMEPISETKEVSEEQTKEQSSPFACCQGSPADVMKNLQAACGMAA